MPIVKVLTRSSPNSYGSLVNYLMREGKGKDGIAKPILLTHNLRGSTKEEFIQGFLENESWRKYTRKDAVLLYHEIVSFGKGDVKNITTEMLIDLAEKYMDYRGRDGQYLAALHEDRENAHIHFAVSGVKYKTGMAHRLTRNDLALLKDNIQTYQHKYDLSFSSPRHGLGKEYETNAEYHTKRRNERSAAKVLLKEQVEELYKQAKTQPEFLELLQNAGLAVYERNGVPTGIILDGSDMKFRFSRMDIPFDELPIDRTEEEKVLNEIREIRENRYELDRDDMERYIHLNPNSLFE